jgi:hypothetical protein
MDGRDMRRVKAGAGLGELESVGLGVDRTAAVADGRTARVGKVF